MQVADKFVVKSLESLIDTMYETGSNSDTRELLEVYREILDTCSATHRSRVLVNIKGILNSLNYNVL